MYERFKRMLIGAPRDIEDPDIFHQVSLIAFLAWIGLGSDGLSSSAYGPAEAFRALGEHRELALFLAIATAFTVVIISFSYSNIIEHFPNGGGGYVVATKLLGAPAGLVSGSALLIDYVLTITTSIASGGDALLATIPSDFTVLGVGIHDLAPYKLTFEYVAIIGLVIMNLRGVKESITILIPIFMLFIATHVVMLGAGFFQHFHDIPARVQEVNTGLHSGFATLGIWGLFVIFAKAYSMGAGTFTGIEAVSNGLAIMREPKVATGKRTMIYMAASLALTAGGILVGYLLLNVHVNGEEPLNATLLKELVKGSTIFGYWFVVLTLVAEALLLLIAAQTGFIDGPRVMANMALDSWLPHRFSSLSERLTMHDGIFLMGGASILALWYTGGKVEMLVTMYSINVFITFSLSQLGMCKFYLTQRSKLPAWKIPFAIQLTGLVLCVGILALVVIEKFANGAWMTLVVTYLMITLCAVIRRYYQQVYKKLSLLSIEADEPPPSNMKPAPAHMENKSSTAVLLVGNYGGLGTHSFFEIRRLFPDTFTQIVFLSVAVVDSGSFKGSDEIDKLKEQTHEALDKYVILARKFGMAATSMMSVNNEPVGGAEELCVETALRFPRSTFFAGKLVFQREKWYERVMHNETAFAIQRRLQWLGYPMVVLPVRVWGQKAIPAASGVRPAPVIKSRV